MIETRVASYGGVYLTPAQKGGMRSAALFATVCRDCGSVIAKKLKSCLPKKNAESKINFNLA